MTWIITNWQLLVGISGGIALIIVAVTAFIMGNKYGVSNATNDALNAEITRRNALQKEVDRINQAARDTEAKLPSNTPSKPPTGPLPPSIIITTIIAFLWFMGCATQSPVLVKPTLPSLIKYSAEHKTVMYTHVNKQYCADETSFQDMVHNNDEDERVIKDYETEIDLYNEFLKVYYSNNN